MKKETLDIVHKHIHDPNYVVYFDLLPDNKINDKTEMQVSLLTGPISMDRLKAFFNRWFKERNSVFIQICDLDDYQIFAIYVDKRVWIIE